MHIDQQGVQYVVSAMHRLVESQFYLGAVVERKGGGGGEEGGGGEAFFNSTVTHIRKLTEWTSNRFDLK